MKIFFVLASFKLGGTERTASRIGLELIRRGYDVKFLLINGVFDYNDELLVKNSIVLSDPKDSPGIKKLIKVYVKLLKLVWRQKPARLVSFSLGINKLIFFLFYPKTVFRIESNIFIYKKKLYRRYLIRFFARFPHIKKIVIPSKGLYEAAVNYFSVPQKLTLISNPLDVENIQALRTESLNDFAMLEPDRFIVTGGRLHVSKGFEQLIRVYKKSKLYPSIKLVVLGQGEIFTKLQSLIATEKLNDNVILAGYQNNPYRFIARARYFVLNSDHESFGNVLIESFACGIPVISNDCDFGPRHIIIDGYNGLLYHKTNEGEFIEKLERLAFNDEIYSRIQTGAIASTNTYHVKTIAEEWIRQVLKW